jgi:hypothetical protein
MHAESTGKQTTTNTKSLNFPVKTEEHMMTTTLLNRNQNQQAVCISIHCKYNKLLGVLLANPQCLVNVET